MGKLTNEEILLYIRDADTDTGVDAITKTDLEKIDIDNVPIIIKDYHLITDLNSKRLFTFDDFTPRANSIYLKPSFAGRQVLMGRVDRRLYFSNGRWFSVC